MTALPTASPPRPAKLADSKIYSVTKDGVKKRAHILQRRGGKVYVHYVDSDKRLDEWLPESACEDIEDVPPRKRKRSRISVSPARLSAARAAPAMSDREEETPMTEEEYDIQHHKQITAQRNFEKVNFAKWQIKTWYYSPYPKSETEVDEAPTTHGTPSTTPAPRIPGVTRTTIRSHGRTSELLAGGLNRSHTSAEQSILWVCDRCFKYMTDGVTWELHQKRCTRNHPPGRKVYQRGAHTIWEVDGAKEKLFCQNLSLFGKLFIDVKTLFFDCDNFLFYLLTDAVASRDHFIGFFSKEKVSYDDYNLACIMVLPPYQRKGYGMLLIEFSYELSRRAGKIGTPERPLSDLGLLSYLAYWVSTLVRFLRRFLSVVPPESEQITSHGTPVLATATPNTAEESSRQPRRKRTRAGEGDRLDLLPVAPVGLMDDKLFTSMRTIKTTPNADGSATSHVVVNCTLADLARATNLRVEDAAFALNECGLLGHCVSRDGAEVVAITKEMVDKVGRERKVKIMLLDLAHVLL